MDDLIVDFIEETVESLAEVELDLVELEQNPDQPGTIDQLFRIMHTIKGTCSFINLERLGQVAHSAENLLGLVRDNTIRPDPAVITAVLEAVDQIRFLLDEIRANGAEPDVDVSDLIARLEQTAEDAQGSTAAVDEPVEDAEGAAADADVMVDLEEVPEAEGEGAPELEVVENTSGEGPQTVEEASNPLVATLADILAAGRTANEALDDIRAEDDEPVAVEPPAEPAPAPAVSRNDEAEQTASPETRSNQAPRSSGGAVAQGLRVNVDLIEQLMTLVSELVLTRNQLLQLVRNQTDSVFNIPFQRLSQVTSELQEGVMKTRMQPIGNAWNKLPRIVRDLGIELDKKINLEMNGAETELDRQVLELIKDPLTHMVRNSADHGIESPADRKADGKPETGTISLSARHEGGHIVIELSDDGAGLNADAIRSRIVQRNLVSAAEAEAMDDARLHQFIFEPGFSTTDQVSKVSGRGVGMDVVRTNIEKIGGTIDLDSQRNKGTSLKIKIPLTLAIVSALIVECAGEKFAIPQIAIRELVRIGRDAHSIETIEGTRILRLRQRLLPLINLDDTLGLREGHESGASFVVVCQVGNQQFGLIVDEVYDTEEIVVKPVAPLLRDIRMFSGNTILGDGKVIMILDPNGLATTMRIASHEREDAEERESALMERKTTLLAFQSDDEAPKAVPLSLVDRLERVEPDQLEVLNDKVVVQYLGRLMPLITTDCERPPMDQNLDVIVFSDHGNHVGLVVNQILDIEDCEIRISEDAHHVSCIGNAIVGDKATEVLDVAYFLKQVYPDLFSEDQDPYERRAANAEDSRLQLLMVDDSAFFRNLVGPLLASHGYNMTVVGSAEEVLAHYDAGHRVDLMVSDIEMPGMDGYQLLAELQKHPTAHSVPVVALTSHCTEADVERGKAAGFAGYVAKLDKERLLSTINTIVAGEEMAA